MKKHLLINAVFLTCVYNKDKQDVNHVEQLLLAMPQLTPWEEFGYKYMAILCAHSNWTEFLEQHDWIRRLWEAIQNESLNAVKESVEHGMTISQETQQELHMTFSTDDLAESIADYIDNHMYGQELDLCQSLYVLDAQGEPMPINRKGIWRFGVVNPWPGEMSAEAEILYRLRAGSEEVGIDMIMLSNFGHILDKVTQKQTKKYCESKELDFVLSTHYDTPKCIDAFYYHALWNPPEIPMTFEDYTNRITNNYVMNDDYLINGKGRMIKHLQCILLDKKRDLNSASALVTSPFPISCMLEPKLGNPKLFYCGMNWERVVDNSSRHKGLFKLLDQTGNVKFFGPDKVESWGGIRPWEGYKCYQHPIPFDGFSILKEINECGICLVLSSDNHRRAAAATNRTYEACAAGAVIISDDNPFMLQHFKDAALFIQYNKNNPQDTFAQIMEHYHWIVDHPQDALELAKRAQKIFCEKFAVDKQLKAIVRNHSDRKLKVREALYARDEMCCVLATFILHTLDERDAVAKLEKIFLNIRNQDYRNIQLMIAADERISAFVEEKCRNNLYTARVISLPLYDFKQSRCMTDAEALKLLHDAYEGEYQFFINMQSDEVWFSDHVSTLVRSLEDADAAFAYSGRLHEDKEGYRRTDMFRPFSAVTIYYMQFPDWMPMPGQILFRKECIDVLPEPMRPFLDGMEHNALMNFLVFREKQKSVFSQRMTMSYRLTSNEDNTNIMPIAMQIRIIQDATKNYLENQTISTLGTTLPLNAKFETRVGMNALYSFPIKLLFLIRAIRNILRLMPSNSKLYMKVMDYYVKKSNEFFDFQIFGR